MKLSAREEAFSSVVDRSLDFRFVLGMSYPRRVGNEAGLSVAEFERLRQG